MQTDFQTVLQISEVLAVIFTIIAAGHKIVKQIIKLCIKINKHTELTNEKFEFIEHRLTQLEERINAWK